MRISCFSLAVRALSLCLLAAPALVAAEEASGFDLTLERAIELHDAGSADAAMQIYLSLREDRPTDPRLLFEMARASASEGRYAACVDLARSGIANDSAEGSREAAALGLIATCQQKSGEGAAALATLAMASRRFPADADLRYTFAISLEESGRDATAELNTALQLAASRPELFLSHAGRLEAEGQLAGAIVMKLRYIMAVPQSRAAMGAAEQVLATLAGETNARATGENPLDSALARARETNNAGDSSPAERFNAALQVLLLEAINAESEGATPSALWTSGVEPLLAMAEHDVLDTFLRFVGALARTEGSPEWLAAHREQFERLVEYLALHGAS